MLTLAQTTTLELEVKRSRFIAHAARVDDLEGTLAVLESVADRQASHNCWAWRMGEQYRFHDDGEPGGTAGRPILAAIEGKGLDYTMVVVTRYFGGIKLGAGGLARAYGGVAGRCLDAAVKLEIQARIDCTIEAGFEWTGELHAVLAAHGGDKLAEEFSASGMRMRVSITETSYPELCAALKDATRGAARISRAD